MSFISPDTDSYASDYLNDSPVRSEKTHHSLTPEQDVKGTPTTLPCPKNASHVLIVRENSATGHTFLGCRNFPECNGTAEITIVPKEQLQLL